MLGAKCMSSQTFSAPPLLYFQTRPLVSSTWVAGRSHRRLVSGFMPPTAHPVSMVPMIGKKTQTTSNSRYVLCTCPCHAHRYSGSFPCRVDVGIRQPLSWPMAVSSLWAVRQVQTPLPTRRLRFSPAFLVVVQRSSSTGFSGQTQTISIPSFMSSLAVAYSLVSLMRLYSWTPFSDSYGQDTTTRHASSTQPRLPPSKSFQTSLAPS